MTGASTTNGALASVALWIECQSVKRKDADLTPSTCLGYGPGPQSGMCANQLINVSLIH